MRLYVSRGSDSSATNDSKPQPGGGRTLAARFGRSRCSLPQCLRRLRPPPDCPFRSHPTAPQPHLTPPQPRGSRSSSAHRVPRTRSSRPRGARRRAPTARSHLIYESCSAVWLRWRAPRAGLGPASERAREPGGAAEFRRPLLSRLGWYEAAVRGGTGRGSREGDARRSKHRRERAPRATEERSKAREPSRLGLPRNSLLHRSLIYRLFPYRVRLYKHLLDLTLRNIRPISIVAMAVLSDSCVGV